MISRAMRLKNYFLKDVNPVIRFLIISDTVMVGAMGLLGPIFALFIQDFIVGGDAAVAGMAAGIYLITKSVLQIPVAHIADRIRGERDDFWLMFICTVIISVLPLAYLVIETPLQLYAIQFALGFFTAITFPTFMAIFTRHIDHKKEGTEWGLYFTLTDLMGAAVAAIGGYVAASSGYNTLIIGGVIMSLLGALLLFPIKPYIRKRS